jgi:membrane-associated protein
VPQFKEKPFWSIFISKFIMGAHTTVVLFSGFERINFEKYLKAEILACIIWAPGLIFLGYFFSYTAIHVSHEIWKFSLIVILLVLLFIILDKILAWAYEMFEEFYQK